MLLFCIVNLFGNLLYPLLKVTIVFRVFFCVKISFLIMCVGERERERMFMLCGQIDMIGLILHRKR